MKLREGACLLTEGHVSKRLRTYHPRSIHPTPVITPTSASCTQEAAASVFFRGICQAVAICLNVF